MTDTATTETSPGATAADGLGFPWFGAAVATAGLAQAYQNGHPDIKTQFWLQFVWLLPLLAQSFELKAMQNKYLRWGLTVLFVIIAVFLAGLFLEIGVSEQHRTHGCCKTFSYGKRWRLGSRMGIQQRHNGSEVQIVLNCVLARKR
jgi:hypothetical protein